MEFIKLENHKRSVTASPNINSQRKKQKHLLNLVFEKLKDNTYGIGWEITVLLTEPKDLIIKTTDKYAIKDLTKNATDKQLIKLFDETFTVAKENYNEEKINYPLDETLQVSPSDNLPQFLRGLTQILQYLQASSSP